MFEFREQAAHAFFDDVQNRADSVEGWLLEHVVLPNFTAHGWSLNYRLPPEVR
jgi:hypothetical protein